jgi:hypothetical protein
MTVWRNPIQVLCVSALVLAGCRANVVGSGGGSEVTVRSAGGKADTGSVSPDQTIHRRWALVDPSERDCSRNPDVLEQSPQQGCFILPGKVNDSPHRKKVALVPFESPDLGSSTTDGRDGVAGTRSELVITGSAATAYFVGWVLLEGAVLTGLATYMVQNDLTDPANELMSRMLGEAGSLTDEQIQAMIPTTGGLNPWWDMAANAVNSAYSTQEEVEDQQCDEEPNGEDIAHWDGVEKCQPLGPVTRGVVDRLYSFWGTGPEAICQFAGIMPFDATKCGPMPPYATAGYCGVDRTIGFNTAKSGGELGMQANFAPRMMLAHVWGYVNQNIFQLSMLRQGAAREKTRLADCQAGVFAAFEEYRGHTTPNSIPQAYDAMCRAGFLSDPWSIGGMEKVEFWPFKKPIYGDCETRTADFMAGYEWGQQQMEDELCAMDNPWEESAKAACTQMLFDR